MRGDFWNDIFEGLMCFELIWYYRWDDVIVVGDECVGCVVVGGFDVEN